MLKTTYVLSSLELLYTVHIDYGVPQETKVSEKNLLISTKVDSWTK